MKLRLIFSFVLAAALLPAPALAGDWGYDEGVAPNHPVAPQPMRAVASPFGRGAGGASPAAVGASSWGNAGAGAHVPKAIIARPIMPKPPAVTPGRRGGASAPVTHSYAKTPDLTAKPIDTESVVLDCWTQIYELAGANKLSDEQHAHLVALLHKQFKDSPASAYQAKSVLSFWPKVARYLINHPEQKDNYALLMRALLRYRARSASNTLNEAPPDEGAKTANAPKGMQIPKMAPVLSEVVTDECALIAEILGAQRFAVQGTPPFTEEAVNAYADMACFIYEQSHPGKTIDASDNRTMFAQIVCDKFREAPTDKDRSAMAGFDLSWAKFKIAWAAAPESTRSAMLQKLIQSGAGVAWADVHEPTLECVLSNWPSFKTPALASNAAAVQRK